MNSAGYAFASALVASALLLLPEPCIAVALVEGGIPAADVVVPFDASADERSAAEELIIYLRKCTGAALAVTPGRRPGRPAVLVGLSAAPEDVRRRVRALNGEGYVIEAVGDTLVLAGNGPHGTSFAVYEFLERAAGVRWLWPGDLGEVTPRHASLRADLPTVAREPAFVWRDLGPGGALWGRHDRWSKERELGVTPEEQELQRLWERRNRFGGERIHGGHAFGEILPPEEFGPGHPECYALVAGKRDWEGFDGKHRAQLCTSNPVVIRLVAEYCRRTFDRHPELSGVSISPNDGQGFCECGRCRSLDVATPDEETGREPGGTGGPPGIADRMVRFGNDVAEELARTHPDKKLLLLAYSRYRRPPLRTEARPNLLIQYAVNCAGFWNEHERRRALDDLEGWARMAPTLGVYEYFTQTNFPDMPRLTPDLIRDELRELRRLGVRRYQTQAGNGHAVNGLNFYVLARLLWDPTLDVGAIRADYCRGAFGPAAPAMGRYFDRLIASWRELRSPPVTMNGATPAEYRAVLLTYPPGLRAACRRDLDEALGLAEGKERGRVEFVRAGFDYFEKTIEAAEQTLPLLLSGWTLGRTVRAPADPDLDAFRRVMAAWEERDRYVEGHKNDFVLSYLWVRSNDETRTFNPLRGMRAYGRPPGR